MFFAYNFTFKAYEKAYQNIVYLLKNIVWQYVDLFRNSDTIFDSSKQMLTAAEDVDPYELVEIKFSQTTDTKFGNNADLTGMFAFADCNVNAPKLNLSNAKSCDSMFACYAPSFPKYDPKVVKEKEPEEENGLVVDKHAFKLTIPTNLTFGEGCTTRQMFMLYFPDTLAVAGFDVSKVTDMTRMFAFCRADVLNTGNWVPSACESMEAMFMGASSKYIDMTNWKYTKVKNMKFMFMGYSNSDVSTMVYFPEDGSMRAADGCDGTAMFALCDAKALMLHGLNLEGFTSIDYMFTGCVSLERIHVSTNADWTIYGLAGSYMFYGCTKLTGQSNTKFQSYHTNIEFARVDNPAQNAPGYFTGIWTLDEPAPAENDAEIQSIFLKNGFKDSDLSKVTKVEFKREAPPTSGGVDISATQNRKIVAVINSGTMTISCEAMMFARATSCIHLFKGFTSLTTIEFNNNLDTIAATSMQGMFDGCSAVTKLDLSSLRTANVDDFSYMFENFGKSATNLNFLANTIMFDTNSGTNFEGMFTGCKVSKIDIRNFVYHHAENLKNMFKDSTVADINFYDEGSYDYVGNGISADYTSMFENCTNLTCLKLGGFIPIYGSKLKATFKGCTKLAKIYQKSNFQGQWFDDGSKDTFEGCSALKNDRDNGIAQLGTKALYARPTYDYGVEGLFSTTTCLGAPKNDTAGLIEERFNDAKVSDYMNAKEIKMFNYEKPDSNYYKTDEVVDVSNDLNGTVLAYKVYYLPKDQVTDSSPYYIVVYSDWSVHTIRNSFKNLFKGFKNMETASFGNHFSASNNMDLTGMFMGCQSFTTINSSYNTGSKSELFTDPVSVKNMFNGCTSLSYFSMGNFFLPEYKDKEDYPVFDSMFSGCTSLKVIYSDSALDFSALYPDGPSSTDMFKGCESLVANGTYTYQQCCKDLSLKPGQGPDYRAAVAHNNNTGLFSAGAVMPNSSGNYSVILDAICRSIGDQAKTFEFAQRIQTVEFFKCLESTGTYYTNEIQKYLATGQKINFNRASEGQGIIYIYFYALDKKQ